MKGIDRILKVSTSEGRRIHASVFKRTEDQVLIRVPYIKLVETDNPPFAKKGVIEMIVDTKVYQKTIIKITKYLEDLFLKGLKDEDNRSSSGASNDSRRVKSKNKTGVAGKDEGEGSDSSVHSSSRRKKSTSDDRGQQSSTEVDKVSDKKVE